jgi:protease II
MGAVVNQEPELFLGIIMAVPFVDSLTTNLDHSLPLTVGEFDEFGNAKDKKDHFDYIYSYAPYNNIKKMDYPHMLITTSLSDNRVLFDEPAKFLIDNKYSSKGKIIGMGGSAGGLLMGAAVNQAPELFLGIIMAVPFVDSLTTNLDHSLPLTVGEFDEFGNAKDNKDHFEYIFSYAPYNNIKKMDYPHMLITTSLSDNRVLFDEPAKFTAKLREYKTDNNLLLLKTEMNAGHGGKSGRDGAIEEIAIDYAFALKISKKI